MESDSNAKGDARATKMMKIINCGTHHQSHAHMTALNSRAAEMPVKFQSDVISIASNLAASRLHDIWR